MAKIKPFEEKWIELQSELRSDMELPQSDIPILVFSGGKVFPAKHLYAKIFCGRLHHTFILLGNENVYLKDVSHWRPIPGDPPVTDPKKKKWEPD